MRWTWLWLMIFLLSACDFLGDPYPDRSTTTVSAQAPTTMTAEPPPPATTTTTLPPSVSVGRPWGTVNGVLQFRGNPQRNYYGMGPIPTSPDVIWRYPDKAMCSNSSVGEETHQWCGTGWTGQPIVWVRPDGRTEIIFGAYDRAMHFVDAETGLDTRPPFVTGDLIKGSATLDPDGFPLLYFGSRDNKLRILALDTDVPYEIWNLDAADHPGIWNNDWDSNPSIVDGVLYEGGENGFFFAIELNRTFEAGRVGVSPIILAKVPGWNQELLNAVGDSNASIESSIAIHDQRAYFTNSGGRVVGIDLSQIREGEAPIVFDFWAGDDIDATPIIDDAGFVYISVELERFLPRAATVGQIVKLDPFTDGDPIEWSVAVPAVGGGDGGLWSTPALGDGVLYASTHPGELLAINTDTGEVTWREAIGWHAWSSPVLIGETLLVAVNCDTGGALRAYDVTNRYTPTQLWEQPLGSGCIESTPTVFDGRIYVGSRDGFFYAWGSN